MSSALLIKATAKCWIRIEGGPATRQNSTQASNTVLLDNRINRWIEGVDSEGKWPRPKEEESAKEDKTWCTTTPAATVNNRWGWGAHGSANRFPICHTMIIINTNKTRIYKTNHLIIDRKIKGIFSRKTRSVKGAIVQSGNPAGVGVRQGGSSREEEGLVHQGCSNREEGLIPTSLNFAQI